MDKPERNADMKKTHILLAEDAEQTRATFAAILRKAGYEVTEAADGREALAQMIATQKTSNKVDLLITDIRMEGLDGLQLIDQLAKLQIQVPTLAITGYGDKDVIIELLRKGCSEYIEKPFEAMELLKSVANILRDADSA